MILNILVYKNCKVNCFTNLMFNDRSLENTATEVERGLVQLEDPTEEAKYADLDMYCLGTFDDITGHIKQFDEPVLVVSPREIILKKMASRVKECS